MGSGDHFGAEAEAKMLYAEERMSEELKKRDRERCEEMRRDEGRQRRQAYEEGVLRPRGRRLFVFVGASEAAFDHEHYPLAADKDVKHDPLVRGMLREIEELRAQLPIRRQCACCGAQRNAECFSQGEDVCDKCNLAHSDEESREEHQARVHWQEEAQGMRQELGAAKAASRSSEELARSRGYENDRLKNELLNKTLALKLTTEALQVACAFVRSQPHKLTCPWSANPKSDRDCTCGINRALGLQPEKKLT
jgi:hypothetical protein